MNISPRRTLAKFSLPSNSFYGNRSALNLFVMPTSTSDWKTGRTSQTFTKTTSRTIVEETFLKHFGPNRKRRNSTDSRRSLKSLPNPEKNDETRSISSRRSASPDWSTCRFSLPEKHQNKRRSPPEKHENQENKRRSTPKKMRDRSVSPDWNTTRFSLPSSAPTTPKKKKKSPFNLSRKKNSVLLSRSASPDWNNTTFSLPTESKFKVKTTPRIRASVGFRFKRKIPKNTMYKISQKTLDKLLPNPEIHLYDVVKYGSSPQPKDDFLFGLNLMRSEVLSKIDLLHYKKKLRNTGTNIIKSFQQTKSKSKKSNNEEDVKPIEILDEPEKIVIDDDDEEKVEAPRTCETDDPLLVKDSFIELSDLSYIFDHPSFGINLINENDSSVESVKTPKTNDISNYATKKSTERKKSLDSSIKLISDNHKRNSLPNLNLKAFQNGIRKKKTQTNKKKNIIKIKWPIARKSLLDIRSNS